MSDPINSSPTPVPNTTAKMESQHENNELPKITAVGYPQTNSSSEVKAKATQDLSLHIEDIKQTNNQTANSYLNQALIQRLNSFNNFLSESNFNAIGKYPNNIIDIVQDSALLSMTMQSFLPGFKMVGDMNNMLTDKSIQNSEDRITKLQQQNELYQQQFSSISSELNIKVSKLDEYNSTLEQVKNQQNNTDTSINETDISELKNKINLLIEKSNDIKKLITNTEQTLTNVITAKEQQLLLNNKLVSFIAYMEKTITNIPGLVEKIIINAGHNHKKTIDLIISMFEKSPENIKAEKEIAKKYRENKKIIAEKEKNDNYKEDLLRTKFLSRLTTIFSIDKSALILENLQVPVSLVVISSIYDKKSPNLPHNQPHLGDSMSLDGADNPVAYGMVLLLHRMQDLKKNIAFSNNIMTEEQQELNLTQELFNLQNKVDSLVFDSLNQAGASQASQRKVV